MAQSWIKLHTDLLHDPKILRLNPVSRYAWVGLLLLCRDGTPPGTWKATSRDTVGADLELALSMDDPLNGDNGAALHADLDCMAEARMISIGASGVVTVLHWADRQGYLYPSNAPEMTRERKRNQRLRECHEMSRAVTTEEKRREESRRELQTATTLRSAAAGASVQSPGGNAPTAKGQRPESLALGFERFWSEYPRKRAKGHALKAWTALKPDTTLTARILDAVRSQRDSADWRKAQGRYIPYPATWLRAQRWEDVLDTPGHDDDRLPSMAEVMRGGS